jgi:hypothetical protein
VAIIALFSGFPFVWLLRIAAAFVILTNIEATLLTIVLPEWRADVSSLFHVCYRRPTKPDL